MTSSQEIRYVTSRSICVVQVSEGFSPDSGGTTTSVLQFQDALGGPIVAFQRAGDTEPPEARDVVTVACERDIRGRVYSWASADALATATQTLAGADLIVCHMLYQYHIQWAASLAKALRIPYWVVPHGSLDPYVFSYRPCRKRAWLRLTGQRILDGAERVIFATDRERVKAQSAVGVLDNSVVLPWPVTPVSLSDRVACRSRIRSRLGLSESQRVLLYLGRLHSMKRPLETIRAAAIAGDMITLVVAGPDGDVSRSECEWLCRENGWNNVHFVGPVYGAEKYEYYKAADGYISLSHRENFGHTVAEALVCGLPVILSPGVDLSGELAQAGCGWVLADTAESTAVAAIREFARATPSQIAQLGRRGQSWALAELSPKRFAGALNKNAIEATHGRRMSSR